MRKYFGESYAYLEGDDSEKLEAKQYLDLWKKNLLRKLSRDSFHCEIVDEQWIDRPAMFDGCLSNRAYLSLKLCLEGKWEYELR